MRWLWAGGLLVLCFVVPHSVAGQEVRLGVESGVSVSSFQGNTEDLTAQGRLTLSPVVGPVVGGFVEMRAWKWFFPRVGAKYVQKGGAVRGRMDLVCVAPCPDAYVSVDEMYRISYVEVPIGGTIRLPFFGSWVPGIHVGQYVGFKLRGNLPKRSSFDGIRDSSYGLLIGGTLEYSFDTRGAITLGLRYNRSLNGFSSEEEEKLRVDGLTVTVGYTALSP